MPINTFDGYMIRLNRPASNIRSLFYGGNRYKHLEQKENNNSDILFPSGAFSDKVTLKMKQLLHGNKIL